MLVRTLDLEGLPAGTCNLWVFYLQIQVIHRKKSLRVQVWHLKSKIPVGPGAGNPQVHPCSALNIMVRSCYGHQCCTSHPDSRSERSHQHSQSGSIDLVKVMIKSDLGQTIAPIALFDSFDVFHTLHEYHMLFKFISEISGL